MEDDDHKNGTLSPVMANFQNDTISSIIETKISDDLTITKINGDKIDGNHDYNSSGSDALIIDETQPKQKPKRKRSRKTTKYDKQQHYNPYFNESLFELTQQHHQLTTATGTVITPTITTTITPVESTINSVGVNDKIDSDISTKINLKSHKHKRLKNSPKLNEYTKYLGLQPSLKCTKCTRNFQLLNQLNEHLVQCNNEAIQQHDRVNFKTRNVFLCSACGTYFENWNLYLHMIEIHRRYLCLYCLGMFSVLDDLCTHIEIKHNLQPGYKENLEEFFNTYTDPCCIICCNCGKLFNEQDNFFYHTCQELITKPISKLNQTIPTDDCDRDDHNDEIETINRREIVYSSDSELDFKGFDDDGEVIISNQTNNIEDVEEIIEPVETRKVPKIKLKLGSFPEIEQHTSNDEDSDDHQIEDNQNNNEIDNNEINEEIDDNPEIQIAGPDVPIVELQLEQPLDKFDIRLLIQKCLNATSSNCIYCNHARKISVNGKRLGLHLIAQHRYSAIVSSITAEELIPESFITRIRDNLNQLDDVYFNLESNPTDEGVTFSHIFECFQCRFTTTIHKELYLHNRKLHTKNLLLCIMCKLNFYSYSELICHLCPGAYIIDYDVQFRCCLCVSDDLPSAFRLMVHLRKRHHVCDVCLETCHNQYKLSNHVWKHKLHHFCYRCGIAYRNKPDITRHLFWKHGTESVLCKKCLQKKWPHVYHFCVPPSNFVCDECNSIFHRANSLKVHKRLHSNEKPHNCTIDDCQERFISKKLLVKHELRHREPPVEVPQIQEQIEIDDQLEEIQIADKLEDVPIEAPIKPKIDVYDLPELNLSESSDSEVEIDNKNNPTNDQKDNHESENYNHDLIEEPIDDNIDTDVVIENIWDNFKNYQANKVKFDHLLTEVESKYDHVTIQEQEQHQQEPLTLELALLDHDYCVDPENKPDVTFTEVKPDLSQSDDHDYCFGKNATDNEPNIDVEIEKTTTPSTNTNTNINTNITNTVEKSPQKPISNSSSSDSSSDSDSSSCSCGPNCSCSSSSDSSSSTTDSSDSDSSTEEGRKRQQLRREKRRQRTNKDNNNDNKNIDVTTTATLTTPTTNLLLSDIPIGESDLETTESETDEEFYDKQPHLIAKKILEEKRNQLLAGIESITTPNGSLLEQPSRSTTPNLVIEAVPQQSQQQEERTKKKSKSKKKKKKKKLDSNREFQSNIPPNSNYYQYYQSQMAPITLNLNRNSPIRSPKTNDQLVRDCVDDDASLRASKRRRVPNKFYGYSSDEEEMAKWRKTETTTPISVQQSQFVVPPITIKTGQISGIQPFSVSKSPMKFNSKQSLHQYYQQYQQQQRLKPIEDGESEQESNDSISGESRIAPKVNPDALYCYCKCPYDEVSEMIGCDAPDCKIEWFHFECVGIMVPPKGHWYCPECRKKRQQKREAFKLKTKLQQQQSPT